MKAGSRKSCRFEAGVSSLAMFATSQMIPADFVFDPAGNPFPPHYFSLDLPLRATYCLGSVIKPKKN